MKSLLAVCLLSLLCCSCKDNPEAGIGEIAADQDVEVRKTREQRLLEKTYKRQVSSDGDTLLAYIPQDSVKAFFTRYGKNNPENKVRISTIYGAIDMELFEETPLYRASFIYLVKNNYFSGTFFHRVVKDFVIQAGNSDDPLPAMKRGSAGNYKLPPHFMASKKHVRGSLSSAKEWEDNPENWHNPFDFFITLNPSPHLDGEHTIFGRVIDGMDVADEISKVPTDESDWPIEDVFIDIEILE